MTCGRQRRGGRRGRCGNSRRHPARPRRSEHDSAGSGRAPPRPGHGDHAGSPRTGRARRAGPPATSGAPTGRTEPRALPPTSSSAPTEAGRRFARAATSASGERSMTATHGCSRAHRGSQPQDRSTSHCCPVTQVTAFEGVVSAPACLRRASPRESCRQSAELTDARPGASRQDLVSSHQRGKGQEGAAR